MDDDMTAGLPPEMLNLVRRVARLDGEIARGALLRLLEAREFQAAVREAVGYAAAHAVNAGHLEAARMLAKGASCRGGQPGSA